MKSIIIFFSAFYILINSGCKNSAEIEESKGSQSDTATEIATVDPQDLLKEVDELLSDFANKPQLFAVTSINPTPLYGTGGTIINLIPNDLEELDGTKPSANIEVELIEMLDLNSMVLNNAQTVSDDNVLITGGAYYINVKSNGKPLKMKEGRSLKVEFPKLDSENMTFFKGTRDGLGEMNWSDTQVNLRIKNIADPQQPAPLVETTIPELSADENPQKPSKENYTAENIVNYKTDSLLYEKRLKQIAIERKTYEALELTSFAWINVDRFYNDSAPKTKVKLIVQNDSLKAARFYAIFQDINSLVSESYFKGMDRIPAFENLPNNKKVRVLGISVKNEIPYVSNNQINTAKDTAINVEFKKFALSELESLLEF